MTSLSTLSAQIIIIGDEILNGSISDANTAPIASWLLSRGIHLTKTRAVRDQPEELESEIRQALLESELVITTGGLGPTKDDITKAILGKITNGQLEESPQAIELVSAQYAKMNKPWKRETNLYHMIPTGVDVFRNPMGLAPGLKVVREGRLLLATPGVPRELKAMLDEEFDQLISSVFPNLARPDEKISIRTKGIPEEKIFFELMPTLWTELERFGKVSSLPQLLGVDIHLQVSKEKANKAQLERELKTKLENSPLAPYIWHWGEETIEELIVRKASKKEITIGLSESCTGGLVAHRLTNVSGSSSVFLGSLVTYANEAKINILDVSPENITHHGAVSLEVAEQMANGARNALNCDIAVALTGIAGPGGGSSEKPVGTLCMGSSTAKEAKAYKFNFHGDRQHLKKRFSQAALFELLRIIETF